MKKLFLSLLGMMLALSAAARDFTYCYLGQTLTYTVTDEAAKTAKVGINDDIAGDLVIPSKAKDGDTEYSVTSIGYGAFNECSDLQSVNIPKSVTSIGSGAFSGCTGLQSVNIPSSVTSIGDWAFSGCISLGSVSIPSSVTSVGKGVFDGCLDDAPTTSATNEVVMVKEEPEVEVTYDLANVQIKPEFPGGEMAMYEFLSKNIYYPEEAWKAGIQGTVIVQFTIDKDGTVTGAHALRSPSELLSKEAERMVSSMPKWNPARNNGVAVKVSYTIPIRFALD